MSACSVCPFSNLSYAGKRPPRVTAIFLLFLMFDLFFFNLFIVDRCHTKPDWDRCDKTKSFFLLQGCSVNVLPVQKADWGSRVNFSSASPSQQFPRSHCPLPHFAVGHISAGQNYILSGYSA